MSDQFSPLQEGHPQHDPLAPERTLSSEAVARRRLLLRGVGSGAAAVAALTPVRALATNSGSTVYVCASKTTGKDLICTLSGVDSAAHSFGPNITKVVAGGKKVSYWGDCKNTGSSKTPVYAPNNSWPIDYKIVAKDALPNCSAAMSNKTLLEIMRANQSTEEAHWIGAYLNAAKFPAMFPYTPQQVLDLYNGNQRSKALTFFVTYLEGQA